MKHILNDLSIVIKNNLTVAVITGMQAEVKFKMTETTLYQSEGPCNVQENMVVEHFKETSKLTELQYKLQSSDFVTLSGLLGFGKSQLALKYACNFHKDHPDGLCWRIACQSITAFLNSLKKLADALGLAKDSTKQDESTSNDDSLNSLQQLILSEFRRTISDKSTGCHLMILDDITEETKHPCERLKDALLKLQVKTIVTTWDSAFCDEENLIIVKGFTEKEAVEFLQHNRNTKPDEEKHYRNLAEQLDYLPKLTVDENKLKEIQEMVNYFSEKLKESQWSYRQRSDNLRMAECSLMQQKYKESEDKFKMVAPDDMLKCTEDIQKTPLNFHELQALKGLTKCYAAGGKLELARELSGRIKSRLGITKEKDELEHFMKMTEDLNLTD